MTAIVSAVPADAIPAGTNMADERAFGLGCPPGPNRRDRQPAKTGPRGRLEPPPEAPCQRISIHLPDVVAYGRRPGGASSVWAASRPDEPGNRGFGPGRRPSFSLCARIHNVSIHECRCGCDRNFGSEKASWGSVGADSGPSRTVIPAHCGQQSGDCGQFLMSV